MLGLRNRFCFGSRFTNIEIFRLPLFELEKVFKDGIDSFVNILPKLRCRTFTETSAYKTIWRKFFSTAPWEAETWIFILETRITHPSLKEKLYKVKWHPRLFLALRACKLARINTEGWSCEQHLKPEKNCQNTLPYDVQCTLTQCVRKKWRKRKRFFFFFAWIRDLFLVVPLKKSKQWY